MGLLDSPEADGGGGSRPEEVVRVQSEALHVGEREPAKHGLRRSSHSQFRKQIYVKVVASLNAAVRADDYPQDEEDNLLSLEEDSVHEEDEGLLIDTLRGDGGDEHPISEEDALEGCRYLMGEQAQGLRV